MENNIYKVFQLSCSEALCLLSCLAYAFRSAVKLKSLILTLLHQCQPHGPELRTLRLAIASAAAAGPPVGAMLGPDLGEADRIAMRVFMENIRQQFEWKIGDHMDLDGLSRYIQSYQCHRQQNEMKKLQFRNNGGGLYGDLGATPQLVLVLTLSKISGARSHEVHGFRLRLPTNPARGPAIQAHYFQ